MKLDAFLFISSEKNKKDKIIRGLKWNIHRKCRIRCSLEFCNFVFLIFLRWVEENISLLKV